MKNGIIPLRMSPEKPTSQTKICPTCGTRLADNATRCLVCGSEFTPRVEAKSRKSVQGARMPEIRLSLPLALALLVLILGLGAGGVFAGLQFTGNITVPTVVPTITETPTATPTPTETLTPTPSPTFTPLPPIDYVVQANDTCSGIALVFGVSVQSIIIENNLSSTCFLTPGTTLKIPRPTPTPAPQATSTLTGVDATKAACQTDRYTVQANDTLSSIAGAYNVPQQAIKDWNGMTSDQVFFGTTITIPLCARAATPGPTPTPTPAPPYPPPPLLLPADGAPFTLANNTVTLQWASIGVLRENEAYMVVVEDVTAGTDRRLVDYVLDTKFIVPVSFRPLENVAHVLRWWVAPVRQSGTDSNGNPVWASAGSTSLQRVFTWSGSAPAATPTP